MHVFDHIFGLAQLAVAHHLKTVVLSPGSRVAPLALAFARTPTLHTLSMVDERSAAFVALGIAQEYLRQHLAAGSAAAQHTPLPLVAVACTSGTAALNYAPAVAEAYYRRIPLLVLTADRPPEWIDQLDGQTIRQRNLYAAHIKASFELPSDYAHPDAQWYARRVWQEALRLMGQPPYLPVHINMPFREPFYPAADWQPTPTHHRLTHNVGGQAVLSPIAWQAIISQWEQAENKLIVVGQSSRDTEMLHYLALLAQDFQVPVVGDIIANLPRGADFIHQADALLMQDRPELRPDLLITCGQSLVSKNLKQHLRRYPAKVHWHITQDEPAPDTFQSLTHVVPVQAAYFFKQLYQDLDLRTMLERDEIAEPEAYKQAWASAVRATQRRFYAFDASQNAFAEWKICGEIISRLPDGVLLHLGNSMPVRYANFWAEALPQGVEVCANRGTSGIDGSVSTAVGNAIAAPERLVVLLVGDLSFFYDRNGLWLHAVPANLRFIIFNNQGGNIFRMIEGPAQQPELEQYFETPHHLTAANTARDFGLAYHQARDFESLTHILTNFFAVSDTAQILEIHTQRHLNAEMFNAFKAAMRTL